MDDATDDEDLSLVRASGSLLADLDKSLPRLLFKHNRHHGDLVAHSSVREVDLGYTLKLIEPFQSDPQLLDTHLKIVVPQIADALLQHFARGTKAVRDGHINLTQAASTLLYTLCKIRGRKIVSSLLPNEARHLELVVATFEAHCQASDLWQVHFTLLQWLSHLLLAPFALATISSGSHHIELPESLNLSSSIPNVARRIIRLALTALESPSIAQTAAAMCLARLATRPDMQKYALAESLVAFILPRITTAEDASTPIHSQLGALRFLNALGKSADMAALFPRVFAACEAHTTADKTSIIVNAMGRKLVLKTMSTLVLVSLRASRGSTDSFTFLEQSDALETTIEYHLRSLSDHESLVRHTAAKATSNIISSLETTMGQEILDAVLQNIQDETPANGQLHTVDAFAWHGNVLTLSYALFKRSVSNDQLPVVIKALTTAIAFEQRTANGAVTGTSVRDAANFGLWSLARRFTTRELSAVPGQETHSIFELLTTQLLQAACLDPVGNIRRGSSAALQELVGRHPDHIPQGIALVQAVDFVAVGLRQRAMTEVAQSAAILHDLYFDAVISGLTDWRGLGSADAASRQQAATALPESMLEKSETEQAHMLSILISMLERSGEHDYEQLHGLVLCLANCMVLWMSTTVGRPPDLQLDIEGLWNAVDSKRCFTNAFVLRAVRTELSQAVIKFITAYCHHQTQAQRGSPQGIQATLSRFMQQLLNRHEDTFHQLLPDLVQALRRTSIEIEGLQPAQLASQVSSDHIKPTLHGSGRAFALAALAGQDATTMSEVTISLCKVCSSEQVDWRVVGFKALAVMISNSTQDANSLALIHTHICGGMRDYTIDQRGDVGSLVRLQAIACAKLLLLGADRSDTSQLVHAEILRLSLERLNRVRASAAEYRTMMGTVLTTTSDGQARREAYLGISQQDEVDSEGYFGAALAPLWQIDTPSWVRIALLEGITSCAGSAAEHLIQNCRAALTRRLSILPSYILDLIMQDFTSMFKESPILPSLELLSFLLQARILQLMVGTEYKWRNLLAIVQRSHYKSTDITKILTAVSIYASLVEIESIKEEVVKKLLSMLKTNPYPKVRSAIADTLYMSTALPSMKRHDWSCSAALNKDAIALLEQEI